MQIKADHNFDEVAKAFRVAARQVPFALARTLTKTGQDVKAGQENEIRRVFDRPTRYTQKAVFLRPARKTKLEAEVWLKWGSRPDHYLMPQIEGGRRPLKRFESRMVKTGLLKAGERLVPTGLAPVDAHGNISRSNIVRILSQLKTAVVQGDTSNASDSRRSRSKRAVQQYFWSAGPGTQKTEVRSVRDARGKVSRRVVTRREHLRRGVWMVRRTAFGNAVRPVFFAVTAARYRARYDFYGVAQRIVKDRFAPHWRESWAQAMKTARFAEQPGLV
jgi:hypothetical protein